MKKLLLLAGLALLMAGSVEAKKPEKQEGYQFTDTKTIPTTSVKDQYSSGTCWSYSALSFIENEVLRAG